MTQYPMPTHKDLRTLLLCALYAFVLLFFLSPDSYLRDIFYRCDSAIFFMCGKAWMKGMIPYVDFADSKGPLFWLIYGAGYLLNHHSYVGVFWISVVFYTATLYIAYKLCRLFLEPRPSALCVSILPLALFYYEIHCEVVSEDFSYVFILLALYCLTRILRDRDLPANTWRRLSVVMGVCFSACLLIKWNVAGMIGSLMLVAFILSFRSKRWAVCLGGMVAGAVVMALPFVLYFLLFADFGTFIQEYFINTYRTMDGKESAFVVLTWGRLMFIKERLAIIVFLGLLVFCYKRWRYAWLIFCFFIFRIGMGLAYSSKHYYMNLMPFFLFFLIALAGYIYTKWPRWMNRLTPALCILVAIGVIYYNSKSINGHFRGSEQDREDFYTAAYIMSQVEQPRLMWYNMEAGMGTPVDALPACRYWTRQIGASEEMLKERERMLAGGKADFVIVSRHLHEDEVVEEVTARVEAQGYVPYLEVRAFANEPKFILFGRPGWQFPPEDFHVSQLDVWLKRNIFGI